MKLLRHLFFAIVIVQLVHSVSIAQRDDDVLATSTGMTYKLTSLSAEGRRLYSEKRKLISDTRTGMLNDMIAEILLGLESKATNSTVDALLAKARSSVPEPSAASIQSVYNANRAQFGNRTLEQVRPQIVDYLKHDAEDKAVNRYIQSLQPKYKLVLGKDVNALGLASTEVLATIGARTITLADFEQTNRTRINDAEMQLFEEVNSDLEAAIASTLVAEDAKSRNIDTSSYIATEVTDKLREFTEEERAAIEDALIRRLFAKYNVKILLPMPKPIVQNVSVDDDPSTGNAAAPVTVVMFTDFQCSACARTHPVLKQAIAEYGDKVRFVVRDFPLESIHPNAFDAARAANAARAQGKFVEYGDILYRNQDAQDKASLLKYATELGLNARQFELDFTDAKNAAEVRKDQADGRSYGIGGTPGIFVNGVKVYRLSISGFRSAIDRALKK